MARKPSRSKAPKSRRTPPPKPTGIDADMADEPPRDRLFEILMRRLEVLAPYKRSVQSLMRSALCNPGLALALNSFAIRSMRWMLTGAGINTAGGKGAVRAQGLT